MHIKNKIILLKSKKLPVYGELNISNRAVLLKIKSNYYELTNCYFLRS